MDILLVIITIIQISYFVFCAIILVSWRHIPSIDGLASSSSAFVSVVVVCKNESQNILKLLECLAYQNYPLEKYEVIIVNDHSNDGTSQVVKRFVQERNIFNIACVDLPQNITGKKQGISYALSMAKGVFFVLTDGDCGMGKYWLRTMVSALVEKGYCLVAGPVKVHAGAQSFWTKMEATEFNSLQISGAGLIHLGWPVFCNGANIAYRKDSYLAIKDKMAGTKYVSGDDVFLLQAMAAYFGTNKIGFVKERPAIVGTAPHKSFSSFVGQRIRWASKWGGYQRYGAKLLAPYIFFVHFSFLLLLIFGLTIDGLWTWLLTVVLSRMAIEFFLLKTVNKWFHNRLFSLQIIASSLFYSIYAVCFGVLANMVGFSWKNKRYSR